jgi:pimeloyl-ACP methyl ester carboxylesterase
MVWTLADFVELADGVVCWQAFGEGPPVVLVHGTPYSSFLWRDVALALSRRGRQVFVFDHLGYGESDKHEGQDLTLVAQGRNFAELLRRWNMQRPSVVACDIGGAIVLRALLLEDAEYSDLTLFERRHRRRLGARPVRLDAHPPCDLRTTARLRA